MAEKYKIKFLFVNCSDWQKEAQERINQLVSWMFLGSGSRIYIEASVSFQEIQNVPFEVYDRNNGLTGVDRSWQATKMTTPAPVQEFDAAMVCVNEKTWDKFASPANPGFLTGQNNGVYLMNIRASRNSQMAFRSGKTEDALLHLMKHEILHTFEWLTGIYDWSVVHGVEEIMDLAIEKLADRAAINLARKHKNLNQIEVIKQKLIELILQAIGMLKKQVDEMVVIRDSQPIPTPGDETKKWDTPEEARHSVRVICDEEGLTLEQKNLICQVIRCESGFNIKAVNQNKDGTKDLGICQYNTYWYIGFGKPIASEEEALNNPEKCVRVMISQFRKGRLKDWVCYSGGYYKNSQP